MASGAVAAVICVGGGAVQVVWRAVSSDMGVDVGVSRSKIGGPVSRTSVSIGKEDEDMRGVDGM